MAVAGQRYAGFTLVRRLGAGGMGETWEAVRRGQHGFEQRAAVKLAAPEVIATAEGRELFRREAALTASLRHPNIASLLDVDEERGCIVYELIDGADLRAALRVAKEGRLAPPLVVYLIAQLSRGLAHAHGRILYGRVSPVIHRDVSPGNVVLDYDGNVKLVDFGIAKALRDLSRSEGVKGKLSYMAPEQTSGGEVDGRTDQYGVGVIAYEALSGQRPNDADSDSETLARILSGDHVPVRQRCPQAPERLCAVIEQMMDSNPDRRFASMEAVLDALEPLNPPLTTHREFAALVFQARPPQTIMRKGSNFVSVPLPERDSLPEARSPHARTISGLPSQRVARHPSGSSPDSASMTLTETFDPRRGRSLSDSMPTGPLATPHTAPLAGGAAGSSFSEPQTAPQSLLPQTLPPAAPPNSRSTPREFAPARSPRSSDSVSPERLQAAARAAADMALAPSDSVPSAYPPSDDSVQLPRRINWQFFALAVLGIALLVAALWAIAAPPEPTGDRPLPGTLEPHER